MHIFRFLTVPTLVGWLAAFATCCLFQLVTWDLPHHRSALLILKDYEISLVVGGMWIVSPIYILAILPLSLVDLTETQKGHPVDKRWYIFGLLGAGVLCTGVFAINGLLNTGLFSGNPIPFFLPFVPFAFVVAAIAKRLIPNNEQNG
jgi:hypothetical protein